MVGSTHSGTVIWKKGNEIKIIIKGGQKLKTTLTKSNLQLQVGDKCHVVLDKATNEVKRLLSENEKSFTITSTKDLEPEPTRIEIDSWIKGSTIETIVEECGSFSETGE